MDYFLLEELLTDEERQIRDVVREFVEKEVTPRAGGLWERGEFPAEWPRRLGELGLLGPTLPPEYGGAGLNSVAYGLIMQELEAGDSGLRSFASVQSSLVMYPIYAYGTEEQRRRWLPLLASGEKIGCFGLTETGAGSDPASMETRCRPVNGGWVISTIKNSNPELDGKWGTAMSPAGPGGVAAYGYPNYLHIPAQSRNKEAAGKFVEFLTDASDGPSYAEQIAIRISSLFWTQSFMGLPYAQDELIKPFAESMPVARFPSLAPGFEEFRELHLNPGIQGLVLGTVTPGQFVWEMHENFERINNR
ncbi:MAG: extracellular solute-binding protein [Limnochordales bacterium]